MSLSLQFEDLLDSMILGTIVVYTTEILSLVVKLTLAFSQSPPFPDPAFERGLPIDLQYPHRTGRPEAALRAVSGLHKAHPSLITKVVQFQRHNELKFKPLVAGVYKQSS